MNDPLALVPDMLEALGLPVIVPEPEVLQRDLARIRCKSLASLIASLISEHEPMLRAEHDGVTVTVRDYDGNVMQFTVEEE